MKYLLNPRLPAPHPSLDFIVTIPAHNEESLIAETLRALLIQTDPAGNPIDPDSFEILLLAHNCTDQTAAAARAAVRGPRPAVHVIEWETTAIDATVGAARKAITELAASRLSSLNKPDGIVATTDADTGVSPEWIFQTRREMKPNISAVAGCIEVDFTGVILTTPAITRYQHDYETYRRLCSELAAKLEPVAHEPGLRHEIHTAASYAVRASIHTEIGGIPSLERGEDIAFHRMILAAGHLVRHSPLVRVSTSGRDCGRVSGGLADALCGWTDCARNDGDYMVESPDVFIRYYSTRSRIRKRLETFHPESIERAARLVADLRFDGFSYREALAILAEQPPVELFMEDLETARQANPLQRPVPFRDAKSYLEQRIRPPVPTLHGELIAFSNTSIR